MSESVPTPIQFGTRYAQHVSGPLSQELAENLYFEKAPEGAKFSYTLQGTPGLKTFVTPEASRVRGMHMLNNDLYAVVGNTLYRIQEDGTTTSIGAIEGTNTVRMARNQTHLWIAAESKLYAANLNEIIELVTGDGVGNLVGVTYQDGYLIGAQGSSQKIWLSGLDDATTIDALDFTSADSLPGFLTGCISQNRELLVFKENSIEAYFNSGNAAFPFARKQTVERGCIAPATIAKAKNQVFWLGDDLEVYSMAGYSPKTISTEVITQIIEQRTSPQTAIGWTYQQRGHTFYVLTFSDLTLVYDLATGLWHRRRSDGVDHWRVSAHTFARPWRKQLVGDYTNGKIYELDTSTYDEGGELLRRVAIGTPLWNNGRFLTVDEFFADFETGTSPLTTGQGSDPEVFLDWTADGGKTWGSRLRRKLGKQGNYDFVRANFHALGTYRAWTPRITITDPVPVNINGAYVRWEKNAI